MPTPPTLAHARCAAALAWLSAFGAVAGAIWFAHRGLPPLHRTTLAQAEKLLDWMAAGLLARLAWICVAGARSLSTRASDRRTAEGARGPAEGLARSSASRLATVFLALASALLGGASPAEALSPGSSPSRTTSSPPTPEPTFLPVEPAPMKARDVPVAAPSRSSGRPASPAPTWQAPGSNATRLAPHAPAPARPGHLRVRRPLTPGLKPAHLVRKGDTLWDLASRTLPGQPEPREVTRAVRRWTLVNPRVARHPDRLAVGTVLQAPDTLRDTTDEPRTRTLHAAEAPSPTSNTNDR